MKVKASARIENIFAHAVAMDSRGLRNTIHCIGSHIFIVNADHSMILRFSLRQSELKFDTPVSFNANDYDSSDFEVTGDKIIFKTSNGAYERRKVCSLSTQYSANDLRKLYHKYINAETAFSFYLSKDICALLDEQLSHVELSVESGRLTIRQRNIYTGTVLEITPKRAGIIDEVSLPQSFGPVGLKTKDFTSLFSFCDSLEFQPAGDYIIVRDHRKRDFDGLLAFCMYDEIINLYNKVGREDNGREEP